MERSIGSAGIALPSYWMGGMTNPESVTTGLVGAIPLASLRRELRKMPASNSLRIWRYAQVISSLLLLSISASVMGEKPRH
jgi:hypothetical protein